MTGNLSLHRVLILVLSLQFLIASTVQNVLEKYPQGEDYQAAALSVTSTKKTYPLTTANPTSAKQSKGYWKKVASRDNVSKRNYPLKIKKVVKGGTNPASEPEKPKKEDRQKKTGATGRSYDDIVMEKASTSFRATSYRNKKEMLEYTDSGLTIVVPSARDIDASPDTTAAADAKASEAANRRQIPMAKFHVVKAIESKPNQNRKGAMPPKATAPNSLQVRKASSTKKPKKGRLVITVPLTPTTARERSGALNDPVPKAPPFEEVVTVTAKNKEEEKATKAEPGGEGEGEGEE